jgi:hypothetical protein
LTVKSFYFVKRTHEVTALRLAWPKDVKWLRIHAEGTPLPKEKSLCLASFTLPLTFEEEHTSEAQKRIVQRLLDLGAPYLYLPHAPPEGADWNAIERSLTDILTEIPSLEFFPAAFMDERIRGGDIALKATILWDDPVFRPDTLTPGVRAE